MQLPSLALVLAGAVLTATGQTKIDSELASVAPSESTRVMVVYRSAPSAEHARRATDRGARMRHVLPEARIAAMEVEGRELQELAGDPDVEAIVPDRVVTSTAAAYSIPVQTAGAPTAWSVPCTLMVRLPPSLTVVPASIVVVVPGLIT